MSFLSSAAGLATGCYHLLLAALLLPKLFIVVYFVALHETNILGKFSVVFIYATIERIVVVDVSESELS